MRSIHTIIPYFNSSKTIADTLSSINNQTEPPIKITIINDCSSKNELYKLQEICSNNKLNIEIINLDKNIGTGNIRLFALENIIKPSKSSVFHFLDSDDLIHPNFYSYSLNFFFEKNTIVSFAHISFSNIKQINFSKKIYFSPILSDNKFYEQGSPSKNILYIQNKSFYVPCDLSYRLRYEDWIFFSLLKKNDFNFKKSKMQLSYYRRVLIYSSSASNRFISFNEIHQIANLMSKLSGINKISLFLRISYQEFKKSRFTILSYLNAFQKNK